MATVQPDQIPAVIGCSLILLFLGWAIWFVFLRDNRNNY